MTKYKEAKFALIFFAYFANLWKKTFEIQDYQLTWKKIQKNINEKEIIWKVILL